MSLIKDFIKLAGIKNVELKKVVKEQEEDFSPEEMMVVRTAVVDTIKRLEKEARETNSPSLWKLYKQGADVYDNILDAILKNKQSVAARIWAKQDVNCRNYIFDNVKDEANKNIVVKYFESTFPKNANKEKDKITESKQFNEWDNKDINFYVVLTATEKSELKDILDKVDTTQLKKLVLGTPKDELDDLAIFPESMKQQAHDLAQTRWHDVHKAPEEDESLSESHKKDTRKQLNEWDNKDINFYVVFTATEKSELRDIFDKVDTTQLKKLIIGTPKDELDDLAIFPESMKQQAHDLAQTRWHDAQKAHEEDKSLLETHKKDAHTYTNDTHNQKSKYQYYALNEKKDEVKLETKKVPPEVFNDINNMIKEIKFKVAHLSHIDPTYQEHGYYFRFMILLQQIADMLKQGTDEAFKEAAIKLLSFENIALVQVPDSLWKFLSIDIYKKPATDEKKKGLSLSVKFHEIKKGE